MTIKKLDGDKVAVSAEAMQTIVPQEVHAPKLTECRHCGFMVALNQPPADSPVAATVPSEFDVRTILLDVVPGDHGMGQEVYARNVEDVERVLNEMSARLSFESRTVDGWQPPETAPVGEEILVVATLYSMIYPEPRRVVAKKDSGNSWWAGPIPLSHVTKWMRLPEMMP